MIRKMELNDLDQVMEIEKEAFHEHWKRKEFEYEINENEFSNMVVFEENNQVLGILGYYILFDDAQITTIAVRKSAQGKHIGTQLMEYLIHDCNQKHCSVISLEVRISNDSAIHLYKKFEFIEMNIRKGYYENGEDALFMMKALGGNYE
ncbi:MAG: ribosomal protein S18-alanine N-acetyltransferase [Traorella sp.]